MYFVYLLKCVDGSFYCGIAKNLEKRMKEHNGELPGGSKYTRSRRPVSMVYSEKFESRSEALIREHEIKSLDKKGKKNLIDFNGKD